MRRKVGEYFMDQLARARRRAIDCIGNVRGKGLMIGMELVENRTTKAPACEAVRRDVTRAFHNGLLLLSCGQSTIRFMPPLMI